MIDVWNSLTQEQRRWVGEAARLRLNARTYKPFNPDDEFRRPDTRRSDADHAMWAAAQATGLHGQTFDLVDALVRYVPLHDGDGHYPDLTPDTPWRCDVDGSRNVGESCTECVRRDAEARQHVKRMGRIQLRARDEGLECTHGTPRALTVDAYALEGLLDEVDLLRANATDYQDAIAANEREESTT